MERDPINDYSVGEGVLWAVELGHRAFKAACTENNNHHKYLMGESMMYYMDSEEFGYLIEMEHKDYVPDFSLREGLRMMGYEYGWDMVEEWFVIA